MIFVTVGTHEQPFNRLVKSIDGWKKDDRILEKVVIQTGFSTYEPQYCKWQRFFSFKDMERFIERAKIIITHGGPSSFIAPLQIGKTPIVVPRQKRFGEHVNDHQVDFCRVVAERQGNIILVEDIKKLIDVIQDYDSIVNQMHVSMKSNNEKFNMEFEKIVEGLMRKE